VATFLLIAPVAWAQNTIQPGQWAKDIGYNNGPQPYDARAASNVDSTRPCGSTGAPCAGVTGAAPDRDVGFSGPTAPQNSPYATSSTSMIRQDMKKWETSPPPARVGVVMSGPTSTAALTDPSIAGSSCNTAGTAITDEYGFKYDCRGNRIR